MKERPILFSAPMVKAILEGRKSVTRRVMKPQPSTKGGSLEWDGWDIGHRGVDFMTQFCPYGPIRTKLWVREAWRVAECYDGKSGSDLEGILSARNVEYEVNADKFLGEVAGRYRRSKFMPRWASRIMLEVTGVRVERLQEITDEDALREGIEPMGIGCGAVETKRGKAYTTTVGAFQILWDSINAKRGLGWDKNPWVWVIEFKRVEEKKCST